MKLEEVKRKPRKELRSKVMNIRITPSMSKWMKTNEISPTKVFYNALKELGYKGD